MIVYVFGDDSIRLLIHIALQKGSLETSTHSIAVAILSTSSSHGVSNFAYPKTPWLPPFMSSNIHHPLKGLHQFHCGRHPPGIQESLGMAKICMYVGCLYLKIEFDI